MINDMEGNAILLSENPNAHTLVLGNSGYGKTYFLCRRMEELIASGKTVFLLDYSQSYAEAELVKNQFRPMEMVEILDPLETDLDWIYDGREFVSDLTDALVKVLGIRSYYQKKLLRQGMKLTLDSKKSFTLAFLMEQLEVLLDIEEDAESKKNIYHLLTRIEPYSGVSGVHFRCKRDGENEKRAAITIIQISGYAELQRRFLVGLISEMFWKEVRCGRKKADVILLDEFQNLEIKPGSALSAMLREGRKFGLAVYLSSQFLADYDKEEMDTLMQAANKIIFRPTENDRAAVAELIAPDDRKIWKNILSRLQVGEAVLKGRYLIERNKKDVETPIICKIT